MKKGIWIIILIIVIVLVWWMMRDNKGMSTTTIPLAALGSNGVSGTATLSYADMESPVTVTIDLPDAVAGGNHPAHIHQGSCPTPGTVVYPLENVQNGTSETLLTNASMNDILASLPLAINVHLSPDELNTYLSCGNVSFPQ